MVKPSCRAALKASVLLGAVVLATSGAHGATRIDRQPAPRWLVGDGLPGLAALADRYPGRDRGRAPPAGDVDRPQRQQLPPRARRRRARGPRTEPGYRRRSQAPRRRHHRHSPPPTQGKRMTSSPASSLPKLASTKTRSPAAPTRSSPHAGLAASVGYRSSAFKRPHDQDSSASS